MNNYSTPAGFVDTPFVYAYDGSGLTDGTSYRRLSVRMDGDYDFILRRVVGLPLVAQSISLLDGQGRNTSSAPLRAGSTFAVGPEISYRSNGEILFDLNVVSRAFFACGAQPIYTSVLGFQGVKRRRAVVAEASPAGNPVPFTYTYDLTVNWYRYVAVPGSAEAPKVFYIPIDDYEFSLHDIRICNADGTALSTGIVQIMLYDDRGRALSTAPLPQQFINSVVSGYASCFPVPALTYRVGSVLRFEVTSMICNTDPSFPRDLRVDFRGIRRV